MSYNPDQFTEPQQGLEPHSIKADLANWIDTDVIAEVIIEELINAGEKATFEKCKETWLGVLEELHSDVASAIRHQK